MTNKRITDVDFTGSLNSDESFFVNQNNSIKQVRKSNVVMDIINGGTGATTTAKALENLGASPISHASSNTTYGKGTSSNYGHVKLSDSISSTSGVNEGIAATPSSVKSAYDKAVSAQDMANSAQSASNDTSVAINNLKANIIKAADITTLETKKENIPSGTSDNWKDLFTAPENGFYFINIFAQWAHNTSGYRNARLSECVGGSMIPAPSDENLRVQHVLTDSVYLAKDQEFKLALRQTSGSSLECEYGGRYSYIPM